MPAHERTAWVQDLLAPLSSERQEDFWLRVARWWDDLTEPLSRLYPQSDTQHLSRSLLRLAASAYADRAADLHRLDRARLLRPDWLQDSDMIGYAAYADRFGGTLAGVGERVDYLRELGVRYLHLMPFLMPREGDSDGGYAVADYRSVRPDLGTVDDVVALATTLRDNDISLVCDLVLNHVAKEHEWARRAAAGEQRYRDYFLMFQDRTMPDAYEATLPEVFPDFAPGSFTWEPQCQAWVWTTFNEWQWDVNWANPQVLLEYADIICFLGNLGVEVVRLDAIAFTWKRLGTDCQNQPEVHDLTQVLRAVARIAMPALAFKAEAIVGPRDLLPYLGVGRHAGKVSDLAYHNSLMVQGWSMIASQDTTLARVALSGLPVTPHNATWITYVRCHDDIGWAVDDADAASIGIDGWSHRRFLADWYAGDFAGSWGRGLTFQFNELTGDKRTSGTAGSLVGLHPTGAREAEEPGGGEGTTVPDRVGVRGRESAVARLVLLHAMVYGFGGIPVVWSGDELGMANDPHWAAEPGHAEDNRWAHRPRLDADLVAQRHDPDTIAGAVFTALAHLGRVRAGLPQLHASAHVAIVGDTDRGVLAVARTHPAGPLVGVYNVTDQWRPMPARLLFEAGITRPVNALSGHCVTWGQDGLIWLSPYAAWWVVDES